MRRLLSIIAIVLFAANASAQIEEPRNLLEIGVAGGLNFNRMDFQPSMRQKMYNGMNGGATPPACDEEYLQY